MEKYFVWKIREILEWHPNLKQFMIMIILIWVAGYLINRFIVSSDPKPVYIEEPLVNKSQPICDQIFLNIKKNNRDFNFKKIIGGEMDAVIQEKALFYKNCPGDYREKQLKIGSLLARLGELKNKDGGYYSGYSGEVSYLADGNVCLSKRASSRGPYGIPVETTELDCIY